MFIKNPDGTSYWIPKDEAKKLGITIPIEVFALSCKQAEALRPLPSDKDYLSGVRVEK